VSHARVVVYSITSGTYDQVIEQVRSGLAPILAGQPGFESYRTVNGGDHVVSISLWSSQENAEQATGAAADWVQQHIADRVEARKTVVGEVTELA
jgi:heme-degrading monooxygenase HmoA